MNDAHNREIRTSVLSMDEKLLSLLGTPCWNADLHSCFNGALNLIDRAGNLVVFLPASCYDGPHRIILHVPRQFSFSALPLRRDDVFTVRERTLCNSEGTVIVDFKHPRVWTDRPPSGPLLLLPLPLLKENLLWLLSSLLPGSDEEDASFYSYVKCRIQNNPNLCSTRLSPLHRRLALSCEEILQGIHIHDIEVIERALVHLVGLGKGLTPSGDDIISGFVSAPIVSAPLSAGAMILQAGYSSGFPLFFMTQEKLLPR